MADIHLTAGYSDACFANIATHHRLPSLSICGSMNTADAAHLLCCAAADCLWLVQKFDGQRVQLARSLHGQQTTTAAMMFSRVMTTKMALRCAHLQVIQPLHC
jgi:threonine/homoserine efflux transporter RhtA